MIGEKLAEAVLNRRLRKILGPERVRTAMADLLGLLGFESLLPSVEVTNKISERLLYYAGVTENA